MMNQPIIKSEHNWWNPLWFLSETEHPSQVLQDAVEYHGAKKPVSGDSKIMAKGPHRVWTKKFFLTLPSLAEIVK